MASRRVEDVHTSLLEKLFSESGLVCIRSAPESLESSTVSGESEEQYIPEEQEEETPEVQPEEEAQEEVAEESVEETPYLFPSPSLRRVVPDRVRRIEAQNRIHVLPEEFKNDIDPFAIPKIAVTPQQKYIDILADIVGCTEYRSSLAEFWFLDTLANMLRRAQEDGLHRPTQALLILWYCEWMKEIQHFDAADRLRMLRRFKDNMISAAKFIGEEHRVPTPAEVDVYYKMPEDTELPGRSSIVQDVESPVVVSFAETAYECSLRDLTKILHYIYDLFSTDYQFDLIRSVFTFPPEYVLIDAPYQMHVPKRMYVPLKAKPKKDKSPKKEPKTAKGKKKNEPDTQEYIALMELKARDEREQDEQEERDREHWNRRSHILPLSFAATDEFFDKYWPPPPPDPDPQPMVQVKPNKGRKK